MVTETGMHASSRGTSAKFKDYVYKATPWEDHRRVKSGLFFGPYYVGFIHGICFLQEVTLVTINLCGGNAVYTQIWSE